MSTVRPALLLACLLSPLTLALAAPPPPPQVDLSTRTLRVEGMGETKAVPDEAFIDLAVETFATTANAAATENARKMNRVISALTQAGIPRTAIETRSVSVFPEHLPPRANEAPKLRGYRVANMVSVHVRELERVGPLLDTALAAGANRVDGVRFGLSRPEAAQGEALREAVRRAQRSAEVLASTLGVRLGPILDVSTLTEPPRFIPMEARFEAGMGGDAAPTPIQPQAQEIHARVSLVFAIEPSGAPRVR